MAALHYTMEYGKQLNEKKISQIKTGQILKLYDKCNKNKQLIPIF